MAAALRGAGLSLDFGAARARIRSDEDALVDALQRVYGAFEHAPGDGFHDLAPVLRRVRGWRRRLRPQIELVADAQVLFEPFPADTHLPMLEWGMNFLLAERTHHRLLLHAGVVADGDRALVMPALPGSGKSTLTAALALSGLRLLSDEFGVVDLDDGTLHAMLRPAALKNDAIDVIARFAPHATLGPRFPGTRKGTVAHLAPDAASYAARHARAVPVLLAFPQWQAGAATRVEPMARSRAFAKLAMNAFNYDVLGPDAFDAVARLVRGCEVARITYGDLREAVDTLRGMLR